MINRTKIQKGSRILVTGASGFVGQHLVSLITQHGYEVVALQRNNRIPAFLQEKCFRVVTGDICDPEIWKEALQNVDVVCHLAAYIPNNFEDPGEAEKCYQVNALASLELASAAARHNVKRFVYISAGNMYSASDKPAVETDPVFPAGAASFYFTSKLAGEIYVAHVCRRASLPWIILRIGSPYGTGEPRKKVVPNLIEKAMEGSRLDIFHGGLPKYNFTFVEDVALSTAAAMKSGPSGIYNIASGEHKSLKELAETVVEVFEDRSLSIHIQAAAAVPPEGFPALSIEKARQTWGFSPTLLRDGLRRYKKELINQK